MREGLSHAVGRVGFDGERGERLLQLGVYASASDNKDARPRQPFRLGGDAEGIIDLQRYEGGKLQRGKVGGKRVPARLAQHEFQTAYERPYYDHLTRYVAQGHTEKGAVARLQT